MVIFAVMSRPEIPEELYKTMRSKFPAERDLEIEVKLTPDEKGAFLKIRTLDDGDTSLDYFPIDSKKPNLE